MPEEKKESEQAKADSSSEQPPSVGKEAKAEQKAAAKTEADEGKAAAEATAKAEIAARQAEEAEAAAKDALEKADAAKAAAEAAAEEEYKAIAAEVKADAEKAPDYTFKRQGEEIFRREMGEPEFWLKKEDRFPRPILSAEEQESLTRQVEIPQDQTPEYNPQHVLSPEFEGVSNYERGVDGFLDQARRRLEQLKGDPEAAEKQLRDAEHDVAYLESLHENYFIGMNVFRTAKGGRDKVKS